MKRIELTIKALSPLAIGRQKPGGSVSEAQDYIPGSVIRGAIASQILQLHYQQQPNELSQDFSQNGGNFQTLFLGENPAIFQNAYPAVAKIEDKSLVVSEEVRVLPTTAVSSKTKLGFKPKGNGVFDTLIDRFCAEAYNHPYDPSDPTSLAEGTDTRVEPFGGFYSKNSKGYRSHSVSTRFLTRVGINRRRATSEDDILYSIEVLNESFLENPKAKLKNWHSVVYRSAILVSDEDLAKSLVSFINSHNFRIGGSASRGLGNVKIEAKYVESVTEVHSRIEHFNAKLKERWQLWSIFGKSKNNQLEDRVYFTLDLQSDAILTDNWRRTTVISESMLQQLTGLTDDSELKLKVAYSSYDYHSGWNSAWGLMKDVELVTNKGAVYLFSTLKNREKDWIEALGKLEMNGVGDRTCEGFGQVQISNEFHTVFREEAV